MFNYNAIVVKVYDGDTITVDIDLGFDVWLFNRSVRLYGIDTPEIRGEERPQGLISRDFVLTRIPVGSQVIIETYRDSSDKYGRYLATVWYKDPANPETMKNLNQELLDAGLAEAYLPK